MTSRLKRQAPLLQAIAEGHPQVVKAILRGADNELIKCLAECALNILKGGVAFDREQKTNLIKHKQKIRKLAEKKISLKNKHKIIQTGGFATALLAPLLKPIIAPLAGKLITSAIASVKNIPNNKRFLFKSKRPY